ncbi:lycopene cyclase domain-containing protein [Candidatus Dojkabacteria bacterium]|nr:lycopene cyclase domain-containing protein [Candidatus Dojkabacteria bacterium]
MSTYLLINIAIIIFPLIFTVFDRKRIRFVDKLPALLVSIGVVGSIFVIWDIIATNRGHWAFNPDHVGEFHLFSIPLEEVLFFITVPFSCLFTYESIRYFVKESRNFVLGKYLVLVFCIVAAASAVVFHGEYTVVVSVVSILTFGTIYLVERDFFDSKIYWLFVMVTFGLFFIFNYFLTSIPIVTYGNEIIGLRITTIPVEDFAYNWAMLSAYLFVYLKTKSLL